MTNPIYRKGRLFADGAYTDETEWVKRTDYDVLRGNLSLAEEGLAAATQEIGVLQSRLEGSQAAAAVGEREIERLRAVIRDLADATSGHNKYVDRAAHAAQAWPPAAEPSEYHQGFCHRCGITHCLSGPQPVAAQESGAPGREAGDRAGPQVSRHTTEDDYQHWLTYEKKRGVPHEADLRLAYYAGADKGPPKECPYFAQNGEHHWIEKHGEHCSFCPAEKSGEQDGDK